MTTEPVIGSYRVTGVLSTRPFTAMYTAEHVSSGRRVAIKILRPERAANAGALECFFHELRAVERVGHPGVVEVIDSGRLPDGGAFIATELFAGEGLTAAIRRRRRMELAEVVAIGRQIAEVLAAAHERGVVHCDLKPDHVLLVLDPEAPDGRRVKILGFGCARIIDLAVAGDGNEVGVEAQGGKLAGTLLYMAPEQLRDARAVDLRADIYSLGSVLYQMACGASPFASASGEMRGLIRALLSDRPPPLRAHDPSISPELERVVMRALARQPDERQKSMRELSAELGRIAEGA